MAIPAKPALKPLVRRSFLQQFAYCHQAANYWTGCALRALDRAANYVAQGNLKLAQMELDVRETYRSAARDLRADARYWAERHAETVDA